MNNDRLINSLNKLEVSISELNTQYASFHVVIDKEQRAIESSDLNEIEKIVPEKVSVGHQIEASVQEVSSIFQRIIDSIPETFSKNVTEVSLSNILSVLEEIMSDLPSENLESKVLAHSVSKLRIQIECMTKQHKDLYPKIEANKYLVDTLLSNHRQTHRFWLGLISESQGTYGAHGSHNKQNLTSMISVKA